MAKQFAWSFRYPGPDGKFGRTDLKLINDAAGNPSAIDEKDPSPRTMSSARRSKSRREAGNLIRHRPRRIHNFFVPELRLKQDIVRAWKSVALHPHDKVGVYEVPARSSAAWSFPMPLPCRSLPKRNSSQWKQQQARMDG